MTIGGAPHVAVARDLREHRSSGDRGARRVAADDRALLVADVAEAKAIDEADRMLARDAFERCAERLEVRAVQPARVDAADAANHDRRLRRGAEDERVELLAPGLGVLLRVVQPREGAALRKRQLLEIEQDRSCDERTCERAAAGLVCARYVAPAERSIEREEATAGPRRPLPRGCRSGLAASR
jgi:hypothetical protein